MELFDINYTIIIIFVASLAINLGILLLGIIIWRCLWLGQQDCTIPKGNYIFEIPLLKETQGYEYKISNLLQFFKVFKELLITKFDEEYWI